MPSRRVVDFFFKQQNNETFLFSFSQFKWKLSKNDFAKLFAEGPCLFSRKDNYLSDSEFNRIKGGGVVNRGFLESNYLFFSWLDCYIIKTLIPSNFSLLNPIKDVFLPHQTHTHAHTKEKWKRERESRDKEKFFNWKSI